MPVDTPVITAFFIKIGDAYKAHRTMKGNRFCFSRIPDQILPDNRPVASQATCIPSKGSIGCFARWGMADSEGKNLARSLDRPNTDLPRNTVCRTELIRLRGDGK